MGVCAIQHRVVTGMYNSVLIIKSMGDCREISDEIFVKNLNGIICILGVLLYGYIFCCLMALLIETPLKPNGLTYRIISETKATIHINNMLRVRELLNNCFLILIFHILKITCSKNNPLKKFKTVICIKLSKNASNFSIVAAKYIYWVAWHYKTLFS